MEDDAQHPGRTVVVGVDGSDHALRAVRWGAAEAVHRRLPLRLVLAFTWMAHHDRARPGQEERYRDILLDGARQRLAAAAAVAALQSPGVEVESQLVVGHPVEVLREESARAQVVVIGDRGLSRIDDLLVGSVAVALSAHGRCPVVVVRGRDPGTALPVVVGVDGSATSDTAITFAFDAAAARFVPLVAVHAWSDLVFDPSMAGVMLDWEGVEADERQRLADRLVPWSEKYPEVPVEHRLVRDRAAHALLEQADGAQLVVVGSRGHGEFSGLVLGSVSNALVHRASCPVAVARV